jgi:hypothetical protein
MNSAKKAKMLEAFDAFSTRISDRYSEARQLIEQDRYAEAQQILARLATSHAKTSLSLRNFMVRQGLLPEDDK